MKRILTQLVRYGVSGGAAAVVDLGAFSILYPAFPTIAAAATLSFVMAALVNYTLSSAFVFEARFGLQRFLKFMMFATVGLLFNVSVTILIARLTPFVLIAKTLGIATAFLLNFWLNATFVFHHEGAADGLAADP